MGFVFTDHDHLNSSDSHMDVSLCVTPVGQIMIQIWNVSCFVAFQYSIVSLIENCIRMCYSTFELTYIIIFFALTSVQLRVMQQRMKTPLQVLYLDSLLLVTLLGKTVHGTVYTQEHIEPAKLTLTLTYTILL